MKKIYLAHLEKLIFLVLVLGVITIPTAFGQLMISETCPTCVHIPDFETLEIYKENSPLVLWTKPTIYDHSSVITLNGHSNRGSELPVTITVQSPIGSIVGIEQVTPRDDGEFTVTFNTASPLWKKDGSYIITGHLGDADSGKIFRTQVILSPFIGEHAIHHEISSGIVSKIISVKDTNTALVFLSDVKEDGTVTLYLPRDVIDSKLSPQTIPGVAGTLVIHKVQYDDEFQVSLDGLSLIPLDENSSEVEFTNVIPTGNYLEEKFLDVRILTIPISEGAAVIEIQGTHLSLSLDPFSITEEMQTEDNSIIVKVLSVQPKDGSPIPIEIQFIDSRTGNLVKHVNYDIIATQNQHTVIDSSNVYSNSGISRHSSSILKSDDPVDVSITILGIGETQPFSGPKGEVIQIQVIPEFAEIAILVLVASIIGIIIISKRNQLQIYNEV